MQRSGSMQQHAGGNDPAGASLRSLSDMQSAFGPNGNHLGGKYEIKRKIELYKGSVSTVYKCLLSGGKPVVIKTYHKAKMAEKHFHKLEREIAAMRALCREVGKRGIVQLLDTFEDTHGIYLVMECCEGGDLFKRLMLNGGKLPELWVCAEVIAPLLRVLDRMHELHIMHRDIKPENIFITADGAVKLGDFGLAIDWTKELPFSRSGTLDYMAPEVLMNPATHTQESAAITMQQLHSKNIRPYTCAVDVWAVGCLAYELVCGRPPFEVEDEKQTASLIIYSNDIQFEATATPAWADFVTQSLIKDPRQRPDASTLLGHQWIRSNLERAAAAAAAVTSPPPLATTPPPLPTSTAASSACGTGPGVGDGSSSGYDASCAGSSIVGGSGSGAAAQLQQQRTCTPSTTAHGFRTAAAMLASRASQPSPSTPPQSAAAATNSATASPVTASGAVYGAGVMASAPPQTWSAPPAQVAASGVRTANCGGGSSSNGALRSLLDAFKNASICSGAAATNTANSCSERAASASAAAVTHSPPLTAAAACAASPATARSPSIGSANRCSSGAVSAANVSSSVVCSIAGGGGNTASQLLRTSFQFQLPVDRDGGAGVGHGGLATCKRGTRSLFRVQSPNTDRDRDRLERVRERGRERELLSLGGCSTAAVVGCRTPASTTPLPPPPSQVAAAADVAAVRELGAWPPRPVLTERQTSSPLLGRAASPGQLQSPRPMLTSNGGRGGGGGSPVGAAAAAGSVVGGDSFNGSPSRVARSGAATTGGLLQSPGGGSGSGGLLSPLPRPLGSLSSAGMCGARPPSPPSPPAAQQRPDLPPMSTGHVGPHGTVKPPRPQSESQAPAKAPAKPSPGAAAAVSSPSPRHSPSRYGSPTKLQPVGGKVTPPLGDWMRVSGPPDGQMGAANAAAPRVVTSPSTLQDLTRNWGAVASITVDRLSNIVGSGSGSAFSSPQRLLVQSGSGGGKALDSYGLPAPTPVASRLPPSEYCSPRPAGVLERVKCHLRGGGGDVVSPTYGTLSGQLQQQQASAVGAADAWIV